MDRAQKEALRVDLEGRLSKAKAVILAEYRGLTVAELTAFKVDLKKAGSEFKVAKNRILKKAISDKAKSYEVIANKYKGPIGTVFCYGDIALTAKAIVEHQKNLENLKVVTGLMDGNELAADNLKAIADMPSKEVLLGKILASLKSPHYGLVMTLSGVTRQLVTVISAIRDKKQA